MDVQVNIITYNRPARLLCLMRDLDEQRFPGVRVSIFDDGSDADYTPVKALLRPADEYRRMHHHGKTHWWKLVRTVHQSMRRRKARYYITLDDDLRLCRDFFGRAIDFWERIEDPSKVALCLHRDKREDCWGSGPSVVRGHVRKTGWLECAFLTRRGYYESLRFTASPVRRPWHQRPELGSGVYRTISTTLRKRHRNIYGVVESLVVHAGVHDSQMNSFARSRRPLRTVNFIDGEDARILLGG